MNFYLILQTVQAKEEDGPFVECMKCAKLIEIKEFDEHLKEWYYVVFDKLLQISCKLNQIEIKMTSLLL